MYFSKLFLILLLAISCKKSAEALKDIVVLEHRERRIYIERLVLKQEYIIEKKYLFNEILWKEIELEWKIEGWDEYQEMFQFNEKSLKPTSIEIPAGLDIPKEVSIEFRLAGENFLLKTSLGTSKKEEEEPSIPEQENTDEEEPKEEDTPEKEDNYKG